MLWQLRCHCNPDQYDKFSSTVVAIFPNVCLWRRSLCSNLAFTLKNCIEPPSYASTAYVVAIWPSFLFDSFVKIWDTCENFLGKWFTSPPGKKFLVRLWLPPCRTSIKGNSWTQHEMETMKAPWSMSALPPYNKEICLEECTKEQIQSLPFPSLHQKCCGTLEGEFFCIL